MREGHEQERLQVLSNPVWEKQFWYQVVWGERKIRGYSQRVGNTFDSVTDMPSRLWDECG